MRWAPLLVYFCYLYTPEGTVGTCLSGLPFYCWLWTFFNSSIQMLLSGPWFTSLSPVYSLSFYLYDRAFHRAKVGPLLLLFGCIHHLTVAQPAWNLWDGSLWRLAKNPLNPRSLGCFTSKSFAFKFLVWWHVPEFRVSLIYIVKPWLKKEKLSI